MADGEITLSVNLEAKDVVAKAQQLQGKVQSVFNSVDTSKLSAKMQKTLTDLDKLASKSEQTAAALREMENTKVDNPWLEKTAQEIESLEQQVKDFKEHGHLGLSTEEADAHLKELESELQKAYQAYNQLQTHSRVSLADLHPEQAEAYKNALNEINNQMTITLAKYDQLARESGEASSDGTKSAQATATSFEQVAGKIGLAISAFAHLKSATEQSGSGMSKMGAIMSGLGGVLTKLPGVGSKIGSAFQSMGKAVSDASADTNKGAENTKSALQGIGNSAKKIGSVVVSAFKGIGSAIGTVASKAKSVAVTIGKTLTSAFSKIKGTVSKAFGGATDSMGKFVKKLAVVTLGARGLITLFRKLYTSIKQGFTDIAQFEGVSGKTTQAMASMQASLDYLKNAWAAAFAPIYNIVMPILSALVDKLAVVGNAVAKFMGVLTGQATVVNAVRGSTSDYAKALDKTSKSSGGASKASKQLSDRLASFDKLNVLGKDKDSDSSGGGGGGADSAIDPSTMFKSVSAVSKLGDMVKDAIKSGFDFTDVGAYIGDKIANMLNSIPWSKIQTGAMNIGKGISGRPCYLGERRQHDSTRSQYRYILPQQFPVEYEP